MRTAARGRGVGAPCESQVRATDLKLSPNAFAKLTYIPTLPRLALRMLNFPRAALSSGEEEEDLPSPNFLFFFSEPHLFPPLTEKSSPAPVILRGCFFSIRSPTPACASVTTLLTSSPLTRATDRRLCSLREDSFFYSLQGKGNVERSDASLFLTSLEPRTSSCVFDQEEGR